MKENHQLQKQIRNLLLNVRQNEEKLKRFQALELSLIACSELFELLEIVIYEYRATSKLDHVSLTLYDPEYELQRMLEEEGIDIGDHPDVLFVTDICELDLFYGYSLTPYLGPYDVNKHRNFFPHALRSTSSIAVLPLARNTEMLGSLNLASHQQDRFTTKTASDFLQRLAAIVTVCLKNVKNQEKLKRLGLTDVLTGVNNRRFFDQRLLEEVARAQRDNLVISCLFFDIDHFKKVNDNYGHHVGDVVLREVAALIRMNLRGSDVIARFGGEEFSAILNNTDYQKATEISERIRQSIEQRDFELENGQILKVTISIGIATFHPALYAVTIDKLGQQLVNAADQCLYEAKRNGRNRIIASTDEAENIETKQLEMFNEE